MPGFLKSFYPGTLVYVCVSLPRVLITSHLKGTRNMRIKKFYSFSISLYDIAVDKLNGMTLVTLHHELLPKKTKVKQY